MRPHATNKERDPRVSWFVWMGDESVDITQVGLGYARRFGQEHGYRIDRARQNSLSAGHRSSPLFTIIWCWLAIWESLNSIRGKTSNVLHFRKALQQ